MRSSFATVVCVIIGCIAMCRAQNDIGATALTVTVPDPASSGFTVGTATDTTFTVTFTLQGSVTPTDVKVFFSDAAGSTKSTDVTAAGANAPDGSTAATGTSYADLTASLTLDATNCAAYTKLCASITVTDDVGNNEACADFGAAADKAGTKTCNAEPDPQSSTVSDDAPDASTQGDSDEDSGAGSVHLNVAVMSILLLATLLLLKI